MKKVKVTNVQVSFIKPKEGLVAFASVTIDNKWHFSSIGVYKQLNSEKHRLTFPTKKLSNGQVFNLFHPVNDEAYEAVREAIEQKINEISNEELKYIYYDEEI